MPRPSVPCTTGAAASSATGSTSCTRSRNARKPKQDRKTQIRPECQGDTSMIPTEIGLENFTLNISEEIHVNASLEATFDALLEQIGPANERDDAVPMPMKIEPWPGGRWFRDLGNNNAHL